MSEINQSEILRELKDILNCREEDIVKTVKRFKKEIEEAKKEKKRLQNLVK